MPHVTIVLPENFEELELENLDPNTVPGSAPTALPQVTMVLPENFEESCIRAVNMKFGV